MYEILHNLLKDRTDGVAFKCFDISHICFIIFFVALAVFICLYLKNKSAKARKRVTNILIGTAFGLYVAELFLMPFAYEQINIDKLPFHVCTTMCVMCFCSRYSTFLSKFRLQFAMLGFLSNLTYLIYPAGMMWMNLNPLSYRVVQTLIFHGVMMTYGVVVLVYESQKFSWNKIYKDVGVVAAMTAWAWLGNTLYNHSDTMYNWFFVVEDPFGMFPKDIAPYIMPFLNFTIFFGVEVLAYMIITKLRKKKDKLAAL